MIIEYVRYKIADDKREAFESAYEAAQSALEISPHCSGYEMSHCVEDPSLYILRIEWDSMDGHLEGFRKSSEFQTFLEHVRPYISDLEEMQHYALTSITSSR